MPFPASPGRAVGRGLVTAGNRKDVITSPLVITEVGFDGGSPPRSAFSEQQLGMTAHGRSGHQAPRIPRPVRGHSRHRAPGRPRISRRPQAGPVAADSASPGKTRPARERDRPGLQQPPRCDPQLRILCLGRTRRPIRTRCARPPRVGPPRPRAAHARRRNRRQTAPASRTPSSTRRGSTRGAPPGAAPPRRPPSSAMSSSTCRKSCAGSSPSTPSRTTTLAGDLWPALADPAQQALLGPIMAGAADYVKQTSEADLVGACCGRSRRAHPARPSRPVGASAGPPGGRRPRCRL